MVYSRPNFHHPVNFFSLSRGNDDVPTDRTNSRQDFDKDDKSRSTPPLPLFSMKLMEKIWKINPAVGEVKGGRGEIDKRCTEEEAAVAVAQRSNSVRSFWLSLIFNLFGK